MLKKAHFLFILILGLFAVVLAACGGQEETPVSEAPAAISMAEHTNTVTLPGGGTYTDVTSDGLAAMMENKDFPLINVHIPYAGEIENTDDFIPFNEVSANLDKLPEDKDAQIVIYCRSGGMSAQTAQELVQMGYTNVWNLDGGMNGWTASGRPLLQNQ